MKTSVFLAGASAILATASPINKRAMETEWVTDYVTVTVIAGEEQPEPTTTTVVVQEQPTTTSEAVKIQEAPAVSTVWVQAEPSTTSTSSSSTQAAVQYSTVWVQAEPSTTSTTSTSTTSTTQKAAATTTSSGSSSGSISLALTGEYSTVMTNYHNIHRTNHSVSAVTWDSDLASYAATLAARCKFAHDQTIGSADYGQNIAAWGSTETVTGDENKYGATSVTNQWYNSEMENWSYYGQSNPPDGMDIDLYGHFTQVVWKGTTKIGCATQYCGTGQMYSFPAYFTVCNYKSPGNYGGEYGDNVLSPLGNKMVTV